MHGQLVHYIVSAHVARISPGLLDGYHAFEVVEALDEAMARNAQHLLRERFVVGAQYRRIRISILVEESLDPVGQPLERPS